MHASRRLRVHAGASLYNHYNDASHMNIVAIIVVYSVTVGIATTCIMD